MDSKQRKVFYLLVLFVVVIIGLVIGDEIVISTKARHPNIGFVGWFVIALWFISAFVTMELIISKCEKTKASKDCVARGKIISSIYIALTAIAYVIYFDT